MTYSRKNPYYASLKNRSLLNKMGSTKSTYHIVLEVERNKLLFNVGDSIGCIPLNDPELVEKVLTCFRSDQKDHSLEKQLKEKINISMGTKKLLALIENRLPLGKKKTFLSNLILDKKSLLKYLEENPLHEILKTFPVELSNEEFVASLRSQLPRLYSIASSSLMYPDEIHLTVSELTFKIKEEIQYGIGSRFLCHLANKKNEIGIYVQPAHCFALPDENAPIVMIGPGTGVAPFRAFLQERQYKNAKGKNWLFFGERNKAFDFYYQDYLETLVKDQFLRLDVSFSRDQIEKEYVQHKLYKNAKDLFRWIQEGAYLYICGDAKYMAKDVEATFIKIFEKEGNLNHDEARGFLKTLRKQKRYLTDVY